MTMFSKAIGLLAAALAIGSCGDDGTNLNSSTEPTTPNPVDCTTLLLSQCDRRSACEVSFARASFEELGCTGERFPHSCQPKGKCSRLLEDMNTLVRTDTWSRPVWIQEGCWAPGDIVLDPSAAMLSARDTQCSPVFSDEECQQFSVNDCPCILATFVPWDDENQCLPSDGQMFINGCRSQVCTPSTLVRDPQGQLWWGGMGDCPPAEWDVLNVPIGNLPDTCED